MILYFLKIRDASTSIMLSGDSILQTLARFPCVPLADYPTPLDHLPRLSAQLKREVFIKRDDVIGPALGGNKTRKLEYLLGEAQQRGLRKVATFGGLQSNHARITAAAACKLGRATGYRIQASGRRRGLVHAWSLEPGVWSLEPASISRRRARSCSITRST